MQLEYGQLSMFPAARCKGMRPEAQTLVAWLCFHRLNSPSNIMPRRRTLSSQTGMATRTIDKHLNGLVEAGILKIETRKVGEREESIYALNLDVDNKANITTEILNNSTKPATPQGVTEQELPTGAFSAKMYFDTWKEHFGGDMPKVACAGMKKLVDEYGAEVIERAFKQYCETVRPMFASVWHFIRTPKVYIDASAESKTTKDEEF